MTYINMKGVLDEEALYKNLRLNQVTPMEALEALPLVMEELNQLREERKLYDDCYPCECCAGCREH